MGESNFAMENAKLILVEAYAEDVCSNTSLVFDLCDRVELRLLHLAMLCFTTYHWKSDKGSILYQMGSARYGVV